MKTRNSYASSLAGHFYEQTPKAVFAALAVSYALRVDPSAEDVHGAVDAMLLDEWRALHNNRIVPQKPPRTCAERNSWDPEGGA